MNSTGETVPTAHSFHGGETGPDFLEEYGEMCEDLKNLNLAVSSHNEFLTGQFVFNVGVVGYLIAGWRGVATAFLAMMVLGLMSIILDKKRTKLQNTDHSPRIVSEKPDFSLSREQLVSLSAEDVHAIARGEKTCPNA